jgi:hypothetical protein
MPDMSQTLSSRKFTKKMADLPAATTCKNEYAGRSGMYLGQWWYINGVNVHGNNEAALVKITIVMSPSGPTGRGECDLQKLLDDAIDITSDRNS